MSTLKGVDPATDALLDFISGGVPGNLIGEAKGNYNAYFAHIDSTVDLVGRTIDEIYAFQAEMLVLQRVQYGRSKSSAVGRYQFLRDTLRGLQQELSLPGSDLFTPELQDRLAIRLLVRRGFSAWWLGASDDRQFAHQISLEWASLPDPENDGRSHFDGDAVGNAASTTLANVYNVLARVRSLIPPKPEPLPAPIPPLDPALIAEAVDVLGRLQAALSAMMQKGPKP